MRTAAHEVPKFVFRSTTQIKTKRNPTLHFSVHGFLHSLWSPSIGAPLQFPQAEAPSPPNCPFCQRLGGRALPRVVWLPATQIHSRFRRVSQSRFQRKNRVTVGVQYLHPSCFQFLRDHDRVHVCLTRFRPAASCVQFPFSACVHPSVRHRQRVMLVRRQCSRSWCRLSHVVGVCQSFKKNTALKSPPRISLS